MGAIWRRLIAGACGIALGLGVVRFDFAVVAREMLSAGWLEPGGIASLGGLHTFGYLVGQIHHSRIGTPRQARHVLGWAMATILSSLWLEAFQGPAGWDAIWRFLAGWGFWTADGRHPPHRTCRAGGAPKASSHRSGDGWSRLWRDRRSLAPCWCGYQGASDGMDGLGRPRLTLGSTCVVGFPRLRGHRSGGHRGECTGSDQLLLVVDRADIPDR
jgi:hypothetical protein